MEKREKKIASVMAATEEQIKSLTSAKKSGKYELTIELNMVDGGIADAFLHKNSREKIMDPIDR
jgi:hypothetical protein